MRLGITVLVLALRVSAAVNYSYDSAGRLAAIDYGNGTVLSYTYDKAGNLLSRSISGTNSGPQISAGGIVNGASFQAPLVRGSLATIFGVNLAAAPAQASQLPLPTMLGGVQVTVNGTAAPLIYVSAKQINFQVPFEAPATGNAAVVVTTNGSTSAAQNAPMAEYAPGIFTYARTATALDPIIVHLDNSLVTPANPATAGEYLVIYGTGVGTFDHPPPTGEPARTSPLAMSSVTPTVTIGGAAAAVQFAGLTPNFVGLVQINIQLPSSLPAGNSLPLIVSFGGAPGPAVNLYVR